MTQDQIINILLSIIGFVGVFMATQLMRLVKAVNKIGQDMSVLTNDHTNLKESHREVKEEIKEVKLKIAHLQELYRK